MGDVVAGHGQDGDLSNRAIDSLHNASPLIDCCQFTVQVSGEALSGRNLTLRGGNLAHSLGKRSHVRKNYQNVHALLKGQIFCQCQGDLRRDQTLHHRIVVGRNTALLKCAAEEVCHIVFYTHSGKDDGKFLVRIFSQRCLLNDLGRKLVMGKAVAGKDREFLPSDQSGQSVNSRDSSADIISGIFTGHWI